jgi:hypothetical protein
VTQPAYSLSTDSSLSDDFILTSDVLVNLATSSPVGVFRVNGVPQALFARADGVLCQLSPTSGASSAGWAMTTVGATSGVTEVVAGVQNDGTVHGFYTDGKSTSHIALVAGAWSAPDTLPLLSGLNITTNIDTGELAPYGIDPSGKLALIFQSNSGVWTCTSLAASESLAGLKPVLVLTDAADDWIMAVPGIADSGGYLDLYQGSKSAVLSGPQHVPVPDAVQSVTLGFYMNNSAMFLFTDAQNNLYTSVGSTSSVVAIPNASVANAAAVIDLSSMLHLYTVTPSGTLSVLHQTGWSDSQGPLWAPIIPLDTGLQCLFTDSNPMDAAAFFAVDDEGVLWHYLQDPQTQLWNSGKAQTPGTESYRVAQYRTELTVADANGSPAGNVTLAVTAASGSAVIQGGLLYPIGPNTPVSVTTNPFGKVTLSTIASDLCPPALTVSANGVVLESGINPAASVHAYLSGSSASLNAGTSSQLPSFSGGTLQGAQVDGTPLAPATQDPTNGSALATQACSGIQNMFQIPTSGNTVSRRAGAPLVGFALDLSDRTRPAFLAFHTEEDYLAYRNHGFFAESDSGSWWDDVKDFFDDVWNGIKNAAISVTKFVVHVADATVDLVVQVADEIQNIVGAIVSGIEDVISAVQGVFAWIGAEIGKLIDWLKMLFDWSAIMDTSAALQSALSQAFPYMQGVLTDWAEPLVNNFFTSLEGTVSTAFDTVIAQYQAGQQLGSLVPAGSSQYAPPAGSAVAGRRLATADGSGMATSDFQNWQSNVQNNWLLEKIESFLGMEPTLAPVTGLADAFATLKGSFDTAVDDFQSACNDFAAFFQTALSDPTQLGTIGVADLLGAAKNVALAVLTFLNIIIEALLKVLSLAIGAAGEVLTAEIDIPFFTALWNSLSSLFDIQLPSLSVSGIFCTALAIPVTVLYKVANGAGTEPFPGGVLPSAEGFRAAPGESTAQLGIQYTAAGIAALWALMDTGLDCVPDVSLMVFSLLDLLAPTLLGVFTWPGGIPFSAIPLDTKEDKAAFANWIIGWTPVALGIGTMLAGAISWAPTSKVPRYIDPAGKILLTAFGAINLVSGIVASALGASGGAIGSNIVGPLPVLTQFLRLESLEESSEGLTPAIKLVIDFFAGEGLAVAIAAA